MIKFIEIIEDFQEFKKGESYVVGKGITSSIAGAMVHGGVAVAIDEMPIKVEKKKKESK